MHNNEIWAQSQCLEREEAAVDKIVQQLVQCGFQSKKIISHTRSIWQRGGQSKVISLVDDAWDCAEDRSLDTPYLFDVDTTVITDNWINTPTMYRVTRVPDSFYGIYSYIPANQIWNPVRDYTFAVNRIEFKRMRILAGVKSRLGLDCGHVNFNCVLGRNSDPYQNFIDQLRHAHDTELPEFLQLAKTMPFKNYTIDHDQAYIRSWLNICVETYSSDNAVSLSEKIFRCLVTPVPWVVYSGRYTIARLKSLGFDVLDDIVDHGYDRLLEAQNKISCFVDNAKTTIESLKNQNLSILTARCQSAATKNQQLLAKWSRAWPADFMSWLDTEIT